MQKGHAGKKITQTETAIFVLTSWRVFEKLPGTAASAGNSSPQASQSHRYVPRLLTRIIEIRKFRTGIIDGSIT